MPDYTIKHSTAHIPSCRVVLGLDVLDGYRIDVVQHTEFVSDNRTDEMPSLVEIRIYNPEHNSEPLITMLEYEARGFAVALITALSASGLLDKETKRAIAEKLK